MTDASFSVTLKGCAPGQGTYYVEQNLARLFKIPTEKAKQLLTETPYTLKKGLTEQEARRYETALLKAGCLCELEDDRFDFSGLSIDTGEGDE